MTNKLTNKDMLTRWAERAVRGGWKPKGVLHIEPPYWIGGKKVSFAEYYLENRKDPIPRLISDSEFMKAVYGEGELTILCSMIGECLGGGLCAGEESHPHSCSYRRDPKTCEDRIEHYIKTPRNHMHKAFDIIWGKGNPISYLYDNMPKEGA